MEEKHIYNLDKLIKTSYRLLEITRKMLQSCQLKRNKVYSDRRFIISFFFRRAWQLYESFLMLIKENRLIDSLILLRSFCEMGINLGYIFSDKIDNDEKNIRALKYMLNGDEAQLKIINANLEDFKEIDSKIEDRRDKLKQDIKKIKKILKKKYGLENWDLPSLDQRATESGFDIIKKIYNQIYRYTSNIEHHNIFFGRDYVNKNRCEPRESLEKFSQLPHLKPPVILYLFRIIYIEVLGAFNDEFKLNWEKKLSEIKKIHEDEYPLLRNN